MKKPCKARQYSDTMMCPCGLQWDVNDAEPPDCGNASPEARYATQEDWDDLKKSLAES